MRTLILKHRGDNGEILYVEPCRDGIWHTREPIQLCAEWNLNDYARECNIPKQQIQIVEIYETESIQSTKRNQSL